MFKENVLKQTAKLPPSLLKKGNSFFELDLPTKRMEDWKYTDLSFLNKEKLSFDLGKTHTQLKVKTVSGLSTLVVSAASKPQDKFPSLPKGARLYTQDEFKEKFSEKSSLVRQIQTPWHENNYFSDFISHTQTDHFILVFDSQWSSKTSFALEWLGSDEEKGFDSLLLSVVVLPESSVQLHEIFQGSKEGFLNTQSDYYVCKNSKLSVLKTEGTNSTKAVATARAYVGTNAQFHLVNLNTQNKWSRHNTYVAIAGESAHAELTASYLCDEGQFIDHHTFIDHLVGHNTSKQDYAGVLNGKSVGVFNGKVWIRRDAQKASAEQLSRNLLLSKSAEANSKPELLIDADDVKAKHGATIGQLDQEELFYMQSRGLTAQQSREMVLKSFVFSVADHLPEDLRQKFHTVASTAIAQFIESSK
jgi:Fe-S cluster assembly protein SufD